MIQSGDSVALYTGSTRLEVGNAASLWLRIDPDGEQISGGLNWDTIHYNEIEWLAIIDGLKHCQGASFVSVFTVSASILKFLQESRVDYSIAHLFQEVRALEQTFPAGVRFERAKYKDRGSIFSQYGTKPRQRLERLKREHFRLLKACDQALKSDPTMSIGQVYSTLKTIKESRDAAKR